MPDSLVISDSIELLGGGQGIISQLPMCAGAVFTLSPGFDFGAPQPVTTIVESMILSGEVPFGTRYSNRTIKLDIAVTAQDRDTLAAAREQLMQLIHQDLWTLTWTRDGGRPLVFDCFRAEPSTPAYDLLDEIQLCDGITITFQAFPFGRTDTASQLTFASPLSGTSAPPSPVTLDSYTSVASIAQWSSSTQGISGNSAKWDPGASPADNPSGSGMLADYSQAVAGGPADITGLTSLSFWAGLGSAYWYFTRFGPASFSVTLTDSSGAALAFGGTQQCTVSADPAHPAWTYVTIPIPQGDAAFDYASVAHYEIVTTNQHGFGFFPFSGFGGGPSLVDVVFYLNDLVATPVSSQQSASVRGAIYSLLGIAGTAAAPLSLQVQDAAATAFKTLILHRPGAGSPLSLTPFMSVGNGADTPNGGTQYTVPSLVSGVNAIFAGTYTVMLVHSGAFSSPGTSRTVTVTITQHESPGGATSATTVSRTFTPSTDVTNGMVAIGELTLPYKDIAPDNSQASFSVAVTDTVTADRYLDCLFLDTMGQTVWVNEPSAGYATYWVDEPTPDRDIGRVLGSASGRSAAVSVLDSAFLSGGPLTVDPGNNQLLAYSVDGGAPALVAYYFPRFFLDRVLV